MKKPVIPEKTLEQRESINLADGAYFEDLKLVRFDLEKRKFSDISFETAILEKANLDSSELKGLKLVDVKFIDCNLANIKSEHLYALRAEFSQAKLKDIDLRGSKIENIHIERDKMAMKVDTGQALYLASLFGLKIEDL